MSSRPEVHVALGEAVERAQLLETAVGTALLALDALENRTYLNPDADAYLRLRDAIDHQTLGRSLKKMREQLKLPDDPESVFPRALEARNFLIHHLIRHYGIDMVDPSKHSVIVAHIRKLQSEIEPAYALAQRMSIGLVSLIDQLRHAHGIDA